MQFFFLVGAKLTMDTVGGFDNLASKPIPRDRCTMAIDLVVRKDESILEIR